MEARQLPKASRLNQALDFSASAPTVEPATYATISSITPINLKLIEEDQGEDVQHQLKTTVATVDGSRDPEPLCPACGCGGDKP